MTKIPNVKYIEKYTKGKDPLILTPKSRKRGEAQWGNNSISVE
jgi:hypothetical protein